MSSFIEKKNLESFADYADRNSIFDKFQYLMSRVLLAKPADPYQFMIELLLKPKSK